jgi:hypothetical protein
MAKAACHCVRTGCGRGRSAALCGAARVKLICNRHSSFASLTHFFCLDRKNGEKKALGYKIRKCCAEIRKSPAGISGRAFCTF